MKKILLIISLNLLVANSSLFSQKISNDKKLQIEYLVSQLDTSQFKNNVLYDLVYPLANLKNFNQNNRKDTSNYKHFSQSIFELRLASRNTFKLNNEIIEAIKNYSEKNNICSIGILNIDFTTIKDDAFDQNNPKISIDSTSNYKKLIELPNKNPYQHKHTIIISPLVKELVLTNQPIKFDFDKLFYEMSYNTINNLNITFENNQTINIIHNGNFINKVVSHNFQNIGIKTLKFTGNFNNGQTF